MDKFDIFAILFVAYGIYCAFRLKKDYADYKKSKSYIDYKIYIRNLGVVVGSIFMFLYEISRLIS